MKQLYFILALGLFYLSSSTIYAQTAINVTDANQRLSYSLGNIIGNELKRKKMDLNESVVRKGLQDRLNNITPLIDALEVRRLTNEFSKQIHLKMGLNSSYTIKSRREKNKNRQLSGVAFMKANKQRKGVITLPSGVQYKVITQGNGISPTHSDTVEIELYTHTIDGQPVAYSGPKGETRTFQVNSLIKGLAEVIQLMQTGAKWEVYIPPELAYGRIRRYAHLTVIAEIRLVSVF